MYGVSPAYIISLFGDGFSAGQMADGIATLPGLGFGAYQPEIYHASELDAWINGGAALVAASGTDADLVPTQFVGHFLLHYFSDETVLASAAGLDELSGLCELCREFPGLEVITVPLPAFTEVSESYAVNLSALIRKLSRMGEIAAAGGYRIALEVLPGSLPGGAAGVALLLRELGTDTFGYNLDTGHAWAARANPAWITESLGASVLGTHLCDNNAVENLSLAPGRGTVNWHRVVLALQRIGYSGSWDLEIHTAADRVEAEYRSGLEHINSVRQVLTSGG